MNKYEAVIILNPNLSTKVDDFLKDFDNYACELPSPFVPEETNSRHNY